MIELIPAIDIIDGKCVRLSQGDYDTKKVYNENPLEVANEFEANGIQRLHVVDLDGAKSSHVVNYKVLDAIAGHTSLIIDFGGGIKTDEDLVIAFENGAQMVTLGSVAVKQPVLGICLGMQLMCRHSEEGNADCLGIFDIDVKKFQPMRHEDKVPHMGWNTLPNTQSDLFKGFDKEEFVYFVHSFYVPLNEFTAATTDYILPYSSALHKDNFYATQFHPEKSGQVGERILRNFIEL